MKRKKEGRPRYQKGERERRPKVSQREKEAALVASSVPGSGGEGEEGVEGKSSRRGKKKNMAPH